MKLFSSLLFLFIWSLTAGCASVANKDAVTNKDVTINNVSSDSASINLVNVQSNKAGATIRGKLRRKYTATGPIPGHLDIIITQPDGNVQYSGQHAYMRTNRNSEYSKFHLALDKSIAKGSTIEIKHHETANIVDGKMPHH